MWPKADAGASLPGRHQICFSASSTPQTLIVGGYPKEGNEPDITPFGTSVTEVVPEPILTLSGIHDKRELEIHMLLDHGGWREDDFPLNPVDRS
jgi:hypothetical protein